MGKNGYKTTYITRPLNKNDIKDNTKFLLCELNNYMDTKWEFDECHGYWVDTINEKQMREEHSPSTVPEYKLILKTAELLKNRVRVPLHRGLLDEGVDRISPFIDLMNEIDHTRKVWNAEADKLQRKKTFAIL